MLNPFLLHFTVADTNKCKPAGPAGVDLPSQRVRAWGHAATNNNTDRALNVFEILLKKILKEWGTETTAISLYLLERTSHRCV